MHVLKKKKNALLCAAALALSFATLAGSSVKAGAYGGDLAEPLYATDGSLYPVIDYADLLTDEEEYDIASRLYDIEETYHSSVYLLTVDSTGGRSAMEYADDFYDYNGYGYGDEHDGILALISMENRDFWMTTTGSAIKVYTDSDIDAIFDDCVHYMSDGDFYSAGMVFAADCEQELRDYQAKGTFTPIKFLICLAIGFLLALIPLFIFKGQLKPVHFAHSANDYSSGDFKLSHRNDRFIRKAITKVRIEHDNDSGGGGSSTHTGSSGTSHGGGGGHF